MKNSSSKLAVMQPYFFPYAGYFQLIMAVDTFVFYDDVCFIKGGWINRNRILIDGESKFLTIPCRKASQNKLINKIHHALDDKIRVKLINKVKSAYGNAPHFSKVFPVFEEVISSEYSLISELAIQSIRKTTNYLGLSKNFKISSETYDNRNLGGSERIVDICKKEKTTVYVNPIGGRELYDEYDFNMFGLELKFLQHELAEYPQFNNKFVPGLSILDVLMFNSKPEIRSMLKDYSIR